MKIKLIILFLLLGAFLLNTSSVKAKCCVDDCYDPITKLSTGVCCIFDDCPNPDPNPGCSDSEYACGSGCCCYCWACPFLPECSNYDPNDPNDPNNPSNPLAPTPIPWGVLQATNVLSKFDEYRNCPDIVQYAATSSAVTGVVYTTIPQYPGFETASQTQASAQSSNLISWNPILADVEHKVDPVYTGNYMINNGCIVSPSYPLGSQGFSRYLAKDTTNTFYAEFVPVPPWVQTIGGNVYVGRRLRSYIPPNAVPKLFNREPQATPTGTLSPGIVTYGSDYDLDLEFSWKGDDMVSSKNWIVNQVNRKKNLYGIFKKKIDDIDPHIYASYIPFFYDSGKPPMIEGKQATVYLVEGDFRLDGNWEIADNEKYIFVIPGNLTIRTPIRISGPNKDGFIAFLVKGNITIDPLVGVPYTSSNPVVEGLYVTSGTFSTGQSLTVGKERFVGKGTFLAQRFTLERDLNIVTHNYDTSAELFIYNPKLVFRMPRILMTRPLFWQEETP